MPEPTTPTPMTPATPVTPPEPAPAPVAPTPETPLTSSQVQQLVQQQVDAQVSGLKANNERLIAENKAVKTSLEAFNGIDVEQYKNFQSQVENDEETRLISEGKIGEVVDKRTARMREHLELNVKKAEETAATATADMETYRLKSEEIMVDNALRNAILASDQIDHRAMDDLIGRGRNVFKVVDGNRIEPRDANGLLMVGPDGTTAMTPSEYLESLRAEAPYYWKQSTSAGLSGLAGLPETDASVKIQHAASTGDQASYQALRRKQREARLG